MRTFRDLQKKNKLARYSSKKYSYLRKVASKSSSYILIALAQTRNSVLGYFYKGSKKVARFLYVKCPTDSCRAFLRGAQRNRTALAGFADLCLTARPKHHFRIGIANIQTFSGFAKFISQNHSHRRTKISKFVHKLTANQ